MRKIFIDTETTGLDPKLGHRIVEIAAVEMYNRQLTGRHFHYYLNPDRKICSIRASYYRCTATPCRRI